MNPTPSVLTPFQWPNVNYVGNPQDQEVQRFGNVDINGMLRVTGGGLLVRPGNVWYVNRNITSSGDGKSWQAPFKTIGEAIAQVNADYAAEAQPGKGRNATIFVGEGWYGEVPLLLTASDVTIVGVAPGSHDSIVLYGSATAAGFDAGAGGPALTIRGSNNSFISMGFFTSDPLYPVIRDGGKAGDAGLNGGYASVNGTMFYNCSFVRDVADGCLGAIDVAANEGPYIYSCRFSTSCLDWGVRIRSNGVTNPVGVRIIDCMFVGTPVGVNSLQGSETLVRGCIFIDDMTDRADTITTPITNTGNNLIAIENYWEFTDGNAITGGGDHLNINNHTLAMT